MKSGRKGNLIVAVFCLLVGLALVGAGIYYLASGKSVTTGGIIFALGVIICAMFAVTCVMMNRFEKMKSEADARYTVEQERQYRAIKEMLDRIRAADGNITQDEIASIVAEAKAKAMSDEPFPDGESAEEGDAESGSREAEKSPAEGVATGGGLREGASPYVSESDGGGGREGAVTDRTCDDGDGNVKD